MVLDQNQYLGHLVVFPSPLIRNCENKASK
jgi:hypothetical protein